MIDKVERDQFGRRIDFNDKRFTKTEAQLKTEIQHKQKMIDQYVKRLRENPFKMAQENGK